MKQFYFGQNKALKQPLNVLAVLAAVYGLARKQWIQTLIV